MKLQTNKFGLTQNPIGGHCMLRYREQLLIGEVISVYRNEARGFTMLKVKHFNGELWPLDPPAVAVEMLGRTKD